MLLVLLKKNIICDANVHFLITEFNSTYIRKKFLSTRNLLDIVGIAVDGDSQVNNKKPIVLVKRSGKVVDLEQEISGMFVVHLSNVYGIITSHLLKVINSRPCKNVLSA